MKRSLRSCRLLVLLAAVASLGLLPIGTAADGQKAEAPAPPKTPEAPPAPLWKNLQRVVDFKGWDADPKLTLREALDQLGALYDLEFDINDPAFKAEQVEDVAAKLVLEQALPAMNRVRVETVLQKLLARVPCQSGATYLIRPDVIEITTRAEQSAEIWGAYTGPKLPLVNADFDQVPLEDALKQLAQQTEYSVVLDSRAGAGSARAPVTAGFLNLPLDTAVSTLADMAGLKTTLSDNVLYVTTPNRTVTLRPPSEEEVAETSGLGGLATPTLSPVSHPAFDRRPVNEAMQELLGSTSLKLVVDRARAGDKVRAPVTADLDGVPLETALRLLADLAELKVLFMGNVVYLTTRENAQVWLAEQAKRDKLMPGAGGLGGGGLGGGLGGILMPPAVR